MPVPDADLNLLPGLSTGRRHLPLQGPTNFRDLGGYAAQGGVTAWNRIYRSDALIALSEADMASLDRMGLRTVVDLRHGFELREASNAFAGHPTVSFHHGPLIQDEAWIPDTVVRLSEMDMAALNRQMVLQGGETVRLVFRLLASAPSYPLVFHCRGGRDRTGLLAALILLAVGVGERDVMDDYLLSNERMLEKITRLSARLREEGIVPEEVVEKVKLRAAYLTAALELIDSRFGGVRQYLVSVGVTESELQALRSQFVVPA